MSPIQQLPLEILEIIGANLPAQSYCNFREVCRNTSMLSPLAKLNWKAYQESVNLWTGGSGRTFKKRLYFDIKNEFETHQETARKDEIFMENVQLKVTEYSPSVFNWMIRNRIGEELIRMIRHDSSFVGVVVKFRSKRESCKAFPMIWACQKGYVDVVRILLKEPLIDPMLYLDDDDDDPLRLNGIETACYFGQLDVVKLLLQDPRVNPSVGDNYAIRRATENGHLEIVKSLLQDERVDPSARDNEAIQMASLTTSKWPFSVAI